MYFTGYAWHNRYTYSKERIKSYNEQALGGGFGKGIYDDDGDWQGLYGIAFLDSHRNIEPVIGYAFLKFIQLKPLRLGAGYTLLVTARADIFNNVPFPGVLPFASINYHAFSLGATYIPGASNAGNVLFLMGKWTVDS